jgi:hypothetical protein
MSVKGGVCVSLSCEVKQRVALLKVPFYFRNLLPTSLVNDTHKQKEREDRGGF